MPAFKSNDPVYDQMTDMLHFICQRHMRAMSMSLTIDDAYNILIAPEHRERWREFSNMANANARGGEVHLGTGCTMSVRGSDTIAAPVIPRAAYLHSSDRLDSCDRAAQDSYHRIRIAMDAFKDMRDRLSCMRAKFDMLNCACDNPKQMRAIWPGLVQLLEFTRNSDAIVVAGTLMKAAPLRKEIDYGMTREEYREWAGLIGSGMLMGSRNEPLLPVCYIR